MAAAPPPAIETVVVRAAQLPPAPGDAAFAVVRIAPEALAAHDHLDEVLTSVPGAGLFRRTSSLAANPTTQGISLRAIAPSGAGRALVTLDGAPQNDPFGGWIIWTGLPPEAIGGASLVRGAGAGPYGAGALTGVVALQSLSQPGAGRADLEAGGYGLRRAAGATDLDLGSADLLLSASGEHSDGWIPVRQGRGAADTPLALDAASLAARLQADVGAAVAAVRLGAFQEEREAGLAGANSRARGLSASLTLARSPDAENLGWRLQGWVLKSDLRNRSVAVAAGRTSTTPANDQYQTPATGYGFNAALRGRTGGLFWELGGDIRGAEGESRERFRFMNGAFTRNRVAGGRTFVGGLYGEVEHEAGPWLITGGARVDYWQTSDAHRLETNVATGAVTLDQHPSDRSGATPTARAGVRRSFEGGFYLRAAAYAGFRPPTLNELQRPFRVGNDITEANSALKPERLYGADAAIGRTIGPADFSVGVFANRLDQAITNVTIGFGPGTFPVAGFVPAGGVLRQRQNAGRIDAVGLEADGRFSFSDALSLDGAVTWTAARVDGGESAPQLTGLRPAQAPRLSLAAGLDWRPIERIALALDLRHEGPRFDDDLNSRRLTAYTSLDARLGFKLSSAAEIYLGAENLTDAQVQTGVTADGVVSYGAPRIVRVGLSIRR
jgi:vitamin B12 transporter